MRKKKGFALIWSMVLSAILLLISTTMVDYIIKESRMTVQIDESAVAYSAAKAGVNWATNCLKNSTNPASECVNKTLTIDTVTSAEVAINGNATNKTIESTGTSNGIRRKIEHNWKSESPVIFEGEATQVGSKLTGNGSIPGNFTMEFYVWGPQNLIFERRVGFANSSEGIYARFLGSNIDIKVVDDGVTYTSPTSMAIPDDFNNPYRYKLKIEYLKGLSVRVSLLGADSSCVHSINWDISNYDLPAFTQFYSQPSLTPICKSTDGDGRIIQIGSLTSNSLFLDAFTIQGMKTWTDGSVNSC